MENGEWDKDKDKDKDEGGEAQFTLFPLFSHFDYFLFRIYFVLRYPDEWVRTNVFGALVFVFDTATNSAYLRVYEPPSFSIMKREKKKKKKKKKKTIFYFFAFP